MEESRFEHDKDGSWFPTLPEELPIKGREITELKSLAKELGEW